MVLGAVGVEATAEEWTVDGETLENPLLASAMVRRRYLLKAVQKADLRSASARRGQADIMSVDVELARRTLKAVADPARKGALRSVS